MIPKLKLSLLGLMVIVPLVKSCMTRDFGGSRVTEIDMSRLKSNGIAVIDWSCSGTGKVNRSGANSQEEYCEWNRAPKAFTGSGVSVGGSAVLESVNLPRACVFTTAFDQSRSAFLTQRVVGQPNKTADQSDPDWATQFNSYAFLVGGSEPDTGTQRKGIIGHCVEQKACEPPNCVPDRASDPQICQALNTLGRRGCQVDTNFKVAPVQTAAAVPSSRMGDQIVRPQIVVAPNIAKNCWYVRDPKDTSGKIKPQVDRTLVACQVESSVTDCDSLADKVSVAVTLKIKDTACVGGTSGSGGGSSGMSSGALTEKSICKIKVSDGANARPKPSIVGNTPRVNLSAGTEVFVRGFLNDEVDGAARRWVSIDVTVRGQSFGAGANPPTPTFVAESQFREGSVAGGAVDCRPSR